MKSNDTKQNQEQSLLSSDGVPPVETVVRIPLERLRPFPDHPFKVRDDDAMREAVESIRTYGVLAPAIVRPVEGGYEIISGHRRCRACELAGLPDMPAIVRDMDDDTATILMVDSNLQRENNSAQREGQGIQDEAGGHQAARSQERFNF